MHIEAKRGRANLFYVPAMLSSPHLDEVALIDFYIDTGASFTSISFSDALENRINFSRFCYTTPTVGLGVSVFTKLIPRCKIALDSTHIESVSGVNLLLSPLTPISVIGLDILERYKISFGNNKMFLEK